MILKSLDWEKSMKLMPRFLTALFALALTGLALAQSDEITYNTHVAQIINENCVVCHREGGIGPMQFENYDQVRPWAPLIQLKVANREMPPYAYDHGIGIQDLEGDWRLSQDEIDTVVAWVNGGSPMGPADIVPPEPVLPSLEAWNFEQELGEPDLIIASYHGIPQKYFDKGDPYHCYCHKTTRLISEKFKNVKIRTTFQSRFGPEQWLKPYTDKTLEELPSDNINNILVICPGFASDCVETLEEIAIQGKESFLKSGGKNFDMIPCLNDNEDHIKLLKHLINKNL